MRALDSCICKCICICVFVRVDVSCMFLTAAQTEMEHSGRLPRGLALLIVSNLSRKSISRSFTERSCSSLFKHHLIPRHVLSWDTISYNIRNVKNRKNVMYFSHPRTLHNRSMAFLQQWTLNEVDISKSLKWNPLGNGCSGGNNFGSLNRTDINFSPHIHTLDFENNGWLSVKTGLIFYPSFKLCLRLLIIELIWNHGRK